MFIIMPLVIFYQFFYDSYIYQGKTESDAGIYAPCGVMLLYMWFFLMMIKPVSVGVAWISTILSGHFVAVDDGSGSLVSLILCACFLVGLRVGRARLLAAISPRRSPGPLFALLSTIAFALPLTVVSTSYSKSSYAFALLFDAVYYLLWCVLLYAWRFSSQRKS